MLLAEYLEDTKDEINYCEILIMLDGSIEKAVPSHIMKLIEVSGKSKSELSDIIPISAGVVPWLVDYTKCISVWYNTSYLPDIVTEEQWDTLKALQEYGKISGTFDINIVYEMQRVYALDRLRSCTESIDDILSQVPDREKFTYINGKLIKY